MAEDERNQSPKRGEQLLEEYRILQAIVDRESSTMRDTFAVFLPLSLTAAASLVVALISKEGLEAIHLISLGAAGAVINFLLIGLWWRVANRRQTIRQVLFTRQQQIAEVLGGHMTKQALFDGLDRKPILVFPFSLLGFILLPGVKNRDSTFINLMGLSLWIPLAVWLAVLGIGVYRSV